MTQPALRRTVVFVDDFGKLWLGEILTENKTDFIILPLKEYCQHCCWSSKDRDELKKYGVCL